MPNKRRKMWRVRTSLVACLIAGLLSAFPAQVAYGGGGPENIFLVVNRQSWASQTVANHYIHLRKIPPGNVLYLDGHVKFQRYPQKKPPINPLSVGAWF